MLILQDTDACEDYTYRFCTEGTPANISHAGSHSDLSVLSIPHLRSGKLSDKIDESSDDNLSFSDEGDNILADCILSGMPKADNGQGPNDGAPFVPQEEEHPGCDEADNTKQSQPCQDRGNFSRNALGMFKNIF